LLVNWITFLEVDMQSKYSPEAFKELFERWKKYLELPEMKLHRPWRLQFNNECHSVHC